MKYDNDYESSDVEDRRGSGGGGGGSNLGLLLPLMMRFGWKGGLLIGAVVLAARFFMNGGLSHSQSADPGAPAAQHAGHDSARSFVGYVLDDVQKTWAAQIPNYEKAHVVLYSDATSTGCGTGEAAVGPFYCPRDERVYLDVTFFEELRRRFGVKGDFAQAYVVAHELGHHIQRLTGTSAKVERAPQSAQKGAGNLSVRLELQADCYAGIWAGSANKRGLLEAGDIESAMAAAAAVGDDRLQKQATGTVQPERWTHGSSEERTHWFETGFRSGDPKACDTFSAQQL